MVTATAAAANNPPEDFLDISDFLSVDGAWRRLHAIFTATRRKDESSAPVSGLAIQHGIFESAATCFRCLLTTCRRSAI
jgi:hypothetical protein